MGRSGAAPSGAAPFSGAVSAGGAAPREPWEGFSWSRSSVLSILARRRRSYKAPRSKRVITALGFMHCFL